MPNEAKKKRRSGDKRDALSLIFLMLVAILALYVFSCQAQDRLPFFGKYALVRITTPSMEEQIPAGTYILIEKVDAEEAKNLGIDEIIVFNSRDPSILGKLNTHRIMAFEVLDGETCYVTKGDHNVKEDDFRVRPSDVQGKYVRNLDGLTSFYNFVGQNFAMVAVFVLMLIAVYVALCTASDVLYKKRKTNKELVKQEVEKLHMMEEKKAELEARIAEEVEKLKAAARAEENNTKGGNENAPK